MLRCRHLHFGNENFSEVKSLRSVNPLLPPSCNITLVSIVLMTILDIEDDIEDEYYSDNESINSNDDSEDELVNVKNYTKIIKSFVKYNNNVYLSATIDLIDNFGV